MKKFLFIFLLLFLVGHVQAQQDSVFNSFMKDFDAFKKSADSEFNTFKAQTDSSFQQFLQQTWKEFDVFRKAQPVSPKPQEQPVIKEERDSTNKKLDFIIPLAPGDVKEDETPSLELKESPPIDLRQRAVTVLFNYLGITSSVYYYQDELPLLQDLNEEGIQTFYRELTNSSILWDYNLASFSRTKETMNLNDWGYYLVLREAAKNIFPDKNRQTLFIWYCLVKSGFQVKVGYNSHAVFLLLPIQQRLFDILYLSENGIDYYILDNSEDDPKHIKTYQGIFDKNARIFSFKLNELPSLGYGNNQLRQINYTQQKVGLSFNSNLIDFMGSYPQCSLETYLGTPLSEQITTALDKLLLPLLKDKSPREKVDILLDFIQKSIAYETDQEQFGKERYMFAEECLYYPYADCEDRTNLLSELVGRYTGLKSVVLDFPGHVTLAVHFTEDEHGTFVEYKGKIYIVCDPTYINAKSGMLQPGLENQKPIILDSKI